MSGIGRLFLFRSFLTLLSLQSRITADYSGTVERPVRNGGSSRVSRYWYIRKQESCAGYRDRRVWGGGGQTGAARERVRGVQDPSEGCG